MAISPQRLTIYLYSAHRAVIFAIAQLSCYTYKRYIHEAALCRPNDGCYQWIRVIQSQVTTHHRSPLLKFCARDIRMYPGDDTRTYTTSEHMNRYVISRPSLDEWTSHRKLRRLKCEVRLTAHLLHARMLLHQCARELPTLTLRCTDKCQ